MRTTATHRLRLLPALIFAAVPLAFLIGLALFQLLYVLPDAREARSEVAEGFASLRAVTAVDHAVQDAERGQRGYLITERDTYLAPYTSAIAALPGLMADLQRATRDNPAQQAWILRLQADLTTKLNELAATIDAERQHGFDAARARVDTDIGRRAMVSVLEDLRAIGEASSSRLAARQAMERTAETMVATTVVVGSLVSCLALIAGAVLLAHAYGRAAASEETLQATLDSVREGVAAFDGWGRLRAWNAPFARLLGLPADRLRAGRPVPTDPGTASDAASLIARIGELDATALRTRRPALVTHETARGAVLELFHSRVADGTVTTVLDVTEQRQAEQALRQAQKLESLGQMTGGVAHDFNNLLTIIIGSLAFLRRALARDARALERLDMIQIAADRGAKLTKQLLAFARRQPLEPQVVELGQITRELLPLLRRAVGDGIEVEFVAAAGLWNTTIDAAQFQSAVLNLAINSRDAMPDGGKLTIEVANAALDDLYAARHAEVAAGQYVLFALTDNGAGMDAATLARALDPFFTTKPVGQGSGLGLPQVYGFVKQSGGHLKLYSEVGEGTTVKLYLPRSREAAQAPARASGLAVTGTETVLLVDDDEIVRATVASMLEDLGYGVITAAGGAQALQILERGVAVDLLFTDVVMPGLGGRRLAEQARALAPTLRVLFTSGYTENSIVHNGRLDPGVELLSKPYDRDRLAAKLRRVLDAPTPSANEGGRAAGV
jgi:signal transduction histidine kinase/ActR/RegA family two-component response regulator